MPIINLEDTIGDEGAGHVEFVVRLSAPSTQTVSVNYSTGDGSASYYYDYGRIDSTVLSFVPGETLKTVRVALDDDSSAEGNEGFYLFLNNPTNATIGTGSAAATVLDNDGVTPPVLRSFTITPSVLVTGEGDGAVTFTVTRSEASTVQAVYASTAQNRGSINNGDYTGFVSQPLVYAVGEASKLVSVSITDDNQIEHDESFGLTVQSSRSDPATTFLAAATFTIKDDDIAPPPSTIFTIAPSSVTVNEDSGTVTFTVIRSASTTAQIVHASTVQNHGSTNSGDYTRLANQAVSFAIGERSKTVAVALTDDAGVESDETYGLIVQASAGDPLSTFLASATFTIEDDDVAPPPPNRISPETSIQAAIAAYGDGPLPVGFTRTGQEWINTQTGLFAELYVDDNTLNYILAFRGTENSAAD